MIDRVQTGFRVDRNLLSTFKEACRLEGFGVGQAVEQFMIGAIESKSMKAALDGATRLGMSQRAADIALIKTRLTEIRSLVENGKIAMKHAPLRPIHYGDAVTSKVDTVLGILPRIQESFVVSEVLKVVDEANQYCSKESRRNTKKWPDPESERLADLF